MLEQLIHNLLGRVFGDGLGGELASRGTTFLADELRRSVSRESEGLTSVRLRPGESYLVVARPRATRRERKLAVAQRSLAERDQRLSRPNRSQIRSARRLRKVQRCMRRARPGSRRARRLAALEAKRGARFDDVIRPTRRQVDVRRQLQSVTAQLDASRAERFDAAAASRRRLRPGRRGRVFG
jgi:hypothetical protein